MNKMPPGYTDFPFPSIDPAEQTFPRGSAPGASAFVNGVDVDLDFWGRIIDAGKGGVTGIPAISQQVQAMRSLEVCPYAFRRI